MVTFAEILPPYPNRMWMLCQQMNVTHVVTGLPVGPEGFSYWTPERIAATKVGERPWDFYPILHMTQRFADAGLTVDVIERVDTDDDVAVHFHDEAGVADAARPADGQGAPRCTWSR